MHGGYALYKMSDYFTIDSGEHYDIAVYGYDDLFGYMETKSGKIITPARFSDVQPFYKERYAQVCYPDGRSEFIDTAGQSLWPDDCGDLFDIYAFHEGLFFARKQSADGSISCGAVDADGKVHIDFIWDTLSLYMPWVYSNGYAATKNGRYFILDKQGKISKDCGVLYPIASHEFHRKGLNYWWSFTDRDRPGLLWKSGAYWVLTDSAEEHHMDIPGWND